MKTARLIPAAMILSLLWAACARVGAAPETAAQTQVRVAYAVDARDTAGRTVRVEMTVAGLGAQDEVRVAIPAWAPGAYRLREYHKALGGVSASAAGAALPVERVNDLTWVVRTDGADPFTVSYSVEVDAGRMDGEHCLLHGPDTYLYVVGRNEAPCSVAYRVPAGWGVATGLDETFAGTLAARDYDTFIDSPVELGRFELFEFDQDGVRYQIAVHAPGPVDGDALSDMIRRIVAEQNAMFGGAPFRRYVFVYHFHDGFGGGGLEHLNSTTISGPYARISKDPLAIASVTSHEYFHVWNVKRIRPAELGPFDYAGIVRSKALWFCEGATSYFGDRTLARCGIWTEERYLEHLAGEIEALQNNPDRLVTSVERASEVVWDRKDWPRVDYYNKGELLGLLIDLRIRTRSGGRLGFDDVMRELYGRYCLGGPGPIGVGFPEDGVLRALRDVTGDDWTEFAARYIRGVEELPYEEILGEAGLDVEIETVRIADLGVGLRRTRIVSVADGGEAARAGAKPGDRIVALDGVEISGRSIDGELAKLAPGRPVRVTLGRGDERIEATWTLGERVHVAAAIARRPGLPDAQRTILDGWLAR